MQFSNSEVRMGQRTNFASGIGAEQKVWAVVVTYNPDPHALSRLIDALSPQVSGIFLVDNGSEQDVREPVAATSACNVSVTQLHENLGIASAQNLGIEQAMRAGASFIYLSDQDSEPSSTMITELLSVLCSSHRNPVAAVGPATVDSRTGRASFFVVEKSGLPHRWMQPANLGTVPQSIETVFLIASGTLIPADVIMQIGGMRSEYFIDHVDTEWCFRARAAGYVLLGVPGARLVHQLGDSVKNAWFFGARQVMYHSPLRDYYMFRNTLLMLRDVPMSWVWRGHLLWRLVQFAGYFLVFAADRWPRLKRMALGFLHGLQGQSGRLETATGECHAIPHSPLDPE